MNLFRLEAYQDRLTRLDGKVQRRGPSAFFLISIAIFSIIISVLTASAFYVFSKKVTVDGWIIPPKGYSEIYASQASTLLDTFVTVGEHVRKGDKLFEVTNRNIALTNHDILGSTYDFTKENSGYARASFNFLKTSHQSKIKQLVSKSKLILSSENSLAEKLKNAEKRLKIAQDLVTAYGALLTKGWVSNLTLNAAREQELDAEDLVRNTKSELDAVKINYQIAVEDIDLENASWGSAASQEKANIANLLLKEKSAAEETQTVFSAPNDGRIGYIAGPTGRQLLSGEVVGKIYPDSQATQIEIFVPSNEPIVVIPGQLVRFKIINKPFEKYGAGMGHIESYAMGPEPAGRLFTPHSYSDPVYVLQVHIDRWPFLLGPDDPLRRARVQVSVDILTRPRSLFTWIFDPLGFRNSS